MVELVDIAAGSARLVLAPSLGGGIARLDVAGRPVLRPFAGDASAPFSLASNVLVPFSNRISGGGFRWNGQWYPVAPNLAGESLPIHGDGFQRNWTVSSAPEGTILRLDNGAIGPWRYSAEQRFDLTERSLAVGLTITNTGAEELPFGCGFHPWFPRSDATEVAFHATHVWRQNDDFLPQELRQLTDAADLDFTASRVLPNGMVNNDYVGWSGTVRIQQGPEAVSCTLSATKPLTTAILYSPGRSAGFFCFEPVSHPVDAVNRPDCPGLARLRPGEDLIASMTLSWEET